MKVLIMAAGVGSRISRHLHGQPKCCVDVAGKPLIRRTFELLNRKGITDIAIVTGYNEKYIHEALEGISYTRFFNPFYRVANSISSVWFAKDFINPNEDIMIMNGDVFFEEEILDVILNEKRSPLMLSDSLRIEDADYKFKCKNDLLIKYGKELTTEETTGEYVGIGLLKKKDIPWFKRDVVEAVASEDYNCWWEEIIYRNVDKGEQVFVEDIKGIFWAEVDYIEDYKRIQKYIYSKIN